MPKQTPTVYIVDDDASLRAALTWLFTTVNIPTRAFASAREFLENYQPDAPACLLLDLRMPEISGLRLYETLKERKMDPPTIFLTSYGDVGTAVQAMKMGAVDFLEKPFNNQILLDLVQRIFSAHKIAPEDTTDHEQQKNDKIAILTVREREVFARLIDGKINKIIASELDISIKTVEFHRHRLMHKLEAKTLADLIALAR